MSITRAMNRLCNDIWDFIGKMMAWLIIYGVIIRISEEHLNWTIVSSLKKGDDYHDFTKAQLILEYEFDLHTFYSHTCS